MRTLHTFLAISLLAFACSCNKQTQPNAAGKTVYSTEIWEGPWEFSPDNRLLALKNNGTTDDDVSTLLLKELSGPAERRVPDCDATCLAFSPDGRLLAAGTISPGVNLVDIAAGTVIAKLRGHQTMVTAVAFSPDGKTLACGTQDRTIRLYNVETRREERRSTPRGTSAGRAADRCTT